MSSKKIEDDLSQHKKPSMEESNSWHPNHPIPIFASCSTRSDENTGYLIRASSSEIFECCVGKCKPKHDYCVGACKKYLDDSAWFLLEKLKKHTTSIKFGIGRATYDSAQGIRNGDITREEGVALIKRFDGEFPKRYIEDCCQYMGISLQQYYDAIEKFRSPHLWKKINGKWELKSPIWNGN